MALLLVGLAVDVNLARSPRNKIQAGFDQGTLAGSVRPDDSNQLAFGDIQIDVPEGKAKPEGEIPEEASTGDSFSFTLSGNTFEVELLHF